MTLTIICPKSKEYKESLVKALSYIGLEDYQILDPAHHEIPTHFSAVVFIGDLPEERFKKLKSFSQNAWTLDPPNPNDTLEKKKIWLECLKSIQEWIIANRDPSSFKKLDIPPVKQLDEYLNSLTGRVVTITLPDRRKMGIYPDGQKLQNEYDIEYHASTIINIAKLFNLFDASEIVIKEL